MPGFFRSRSEEEITRASPEENAQYYYERSIHFRGAQHFDLALDSINIALGYDPTNILYINFRGILNYTLGHHEEAIADFRQLVEEDHPMYIPTLYMRGFIHMNMRHNQEAYRDLMEVNRLDPAYLNVAELVLELGEAITHQSKYSDNYK